MTYVATRSSGEERAKRNENGLRKTLESLPMAAVFLPNAPELESRPVRRARSDAVDDAGNEERVVIWIERKSGAVWAVGRSVNPQLRDSDEPRPDEYLFEGYELDDALEKANDVLEDDVSVLRARRPFRST